MRATLTLFILFLGTVSAQAVPRLFVEATANPARPTGTYILRAGIAKGKTQLFAGYLNATYSPDVDKEGYYWVGNRQLIAGVRRLTTTNPLAVVVPSFGGGFCAGQFRDEVWIDRVYMHPEQGLRLLETEAIQCVGVFAEAGVRVPIRPTSFSVAADIHLNFAYGRKRDRSGDVISETETIRGVGLILLGAKYKF